MRESAEESETENDIASTLDVNGVEPGTRVSLGIPFKRKDPANLFESSRIYPGRIIDLRCCFCSGSEYTIIYKCTAMIICLQACLGNLSESEGYVSRLLCRE